MALSAGQKLTLQGASRSAIESSLSALRAHWPNNRWLAKRNRYRLRCKETIKNDVKPGQQINNRQLREYIAASVAVHCVDGWSYLGRALESHLHGDADIARHLGYYAELRATMSLLAAEGIGVFDNKHFVVDNKGKCALLNGETTHQFAWLALEHWIAEPAAQSLIFEIIAPGGYPLAEWLDRFGIAAAVKRDLAIRWPSQWGFDLQRLTSDRDARNIASYRPTSFLSPRALSPKKALGFVADMWHLCSPQDSMRFHVLDRHLLRSCLESAFKTQILRSSRQASKIFRKRIEEMVQGIGPRDLSEPEWVNFLTRQTDSKTPNLLEAAERTATPESPDHHKQVLARATLLLRLASGATERLLKQVDGFSAPNIEFWWSALGEDRGLWAPGGEPTGFGDLWPPVEDSMNEMLLWANAPGVPPRSYERMWREQGMAASILGTCERIGLWGIGL